MKTEDARARLEEILKAERVFTEEALTELAPLIGFREDILEIPMDEDDEEGPKPFCVIRMKDNSGKSGFLADQDAPPSLACYIEFADRIHLTMCPTGGEGKGVVVTVVACGFEPEAYRIRKEELSTRKSVGLDVKKCVHPAEIKEYTAPDGRRGWQLHYPSVEIARGIKSDLRGRLSNKEYSYMLENHISLDIDMVGMRYDSPGFEKWIRKKVEARKNGTPFAWQVSIYPAENPKGGIELRKVL